MKPPRGREPLKDRIKRNAAGLAMYASASPKPLTLDAKSLAMRAMTERIAELPPVRAARVKARVAQMDRPYESTVQAEIIAYLKSREDIGAITRLNSGQAQETGHNGETRYIMFNRTAKGMRVCDLQCMLKPSGRLVAIEVKRPGFKSPKSPRERGQANYLSHIATCGGIGFFATSVQDVKRQLPIERGIA